MHFLITQHNSFCLLTVVRIARTVPEERNFSLHLMEPLTQTKKQLRNENKRRKIAALLEISELNDRDKEVH